LEKYHALRFPTDFDLEIDPKVPDADFRVERPTPYKYRILCVNCEPPKPVLVDFEAEAERILAELPTKINDGMYDAYKTDGRINRGQVWT